MKGRRQHLRADFRETHLRILTVFPDLHQTGGVQLSARLAWDALASAPGVDAKLLECPSGDARQGRFGRIQTKVGAVLRALGATGPWGTALFWHLSLAKLSPLIHPAAARKCLFLHGIECWRPLRPLERRTVMSMDLILTNSDHTWSRFLSENPWALFKDHTLTHLGVGDECPDPPGLSRDPIGVIVARMDRGEDYKGHRELISVWAGVRRRVPGATLVVIGSGNLLPDLQRLAADSSPEGIQFTGPVSDETRDEWLRRARALLMPSRGEGFGLVYLEAMRLGRPCLVSNADAGREVVHPPEAGLAVDPSDPCALAEAIASLLSPERATTWLQPCASRYAMNFTANHFSRRLLEALGIERAGRSKELESRDVGGAAGSDRRLGNRGPGSGGTD